jgi:PTH1 family peptidyl-tRNA hydrolase
MFLFVAIGNVGKEYVGTRHNTGFLVADKLIEEYNFTNDGKKFHSEIWQGTINCQRGIIIKPQTFVNNSGIAVAEVVKFYKIALADVYVFHDDLDLNLGRVKYKVGGSSGGHNGIKSIDELNGREYGRIRIGIGKPIYQDDTVNYVLGKFSEDERIKLENVLIKIVANANILLNNKPLFQEYMGEIKN